MYNSRGGEDIRTSICPFPFIFSQSSFKSIFIENLLFAEYHGVFLPSFNQYPHLVSHTGVQLPHLLHGIITCIIQLL